MKNITTNAMECTLDFIDNVCHLRSKVKKWDQFFKKFTDECMEDEFKSVCWQADQIGCSASLRNNDAMDLRSGGGVGKKGISLRDICI